jgi:hypothetical protein
VGSKFISKLEVNQDNSIERINEHFNMFWDKF